MYKEIGSFLAEELEQIKKDGLFKRSELYLGLTLMEQKLQSHAKSKKLYFKGSTAKSF